MTDPLDSPLSSPPGVLALMPTLGHVAEMHGAGNIVQSHFARLAMNAPIVRMADWETAATAILLPGVVQQFRSAHARQALVVLSEGSRAVQQAVVAVVASVVIGEGGVRVEVAAFGENADDLAEAFIAQARQVMPPTVPDPEAPMVPITFWSYSVHGALQRRRRIVVPTWEAVAANYSTAVRSDVAKLMAPTFEPGVGGQLLLWHGPPGTGKTYALRALAWEWREWATVHYVTDPERLFGSEAAYLLEVLLAGDDDDQPAIAGAVHGSGAARGRDPRAADGPWRLLVLEDTGEMMSADARERSGAGLGRLLNVVDGMIGQGLKVLVLVTTNEQVTKLHPAIARPGRCAARVFFAGLPRAEAEAWLAEYDVVPPDDWGEHSASHRYPIADLFELRAGGAPARNRERQPAGFR